MSGFIQVIEFQTSRFDEVQALLEEARHRLDDGQPARPLRVTTTADRDRPGYYVNLVEFDSYDAAMENSSRPETGELAAHLGKLCDGPPTFYNLDVRGSWERSGPR